MLLAWAAFSIPGAARCQTSPGVPVHEIRAAFDALEYERVDSLARAAAERHGDYEPRVLVEIHTMHGLASFYRGIEPEAAAQFEAALSLDPALTLDPMLVPPRALAFFREIKDRRRVAPGTAQQSVALRYVVVEDDRPGAVLRSFVAPGWGQLHKQQTTKGIALLSLWTASAGGGVAAHVIRGRAEDRYLEATGSSAIAERYDAFNRWHKIRNNLFLGAALVWVYSAVDAAASGGPRSTAASPGRLRWTVHPRTDDTVLLIRASVRF